MTLPMEANALSEASIPSAEEEWRAKWEFDRSFCTPGIRWIVGVDEAGRGCLAGPLFAAAVLFDTPEGLAEIDDSKRLSATRREELAAVIRSQARAFGIGVVSEREIDARGIDWANRIAFSRALRELLKLLHALPREQSLALIDGVRPPIRPPLRSITVRGGDQSSLAIGAASILAKTARDRYCIEVMHARYPQYGFDRHKGYSTPSHRQALREWGPSPAHRRSFSWDSD